MAPAASPERPPALAEPAGGEGAFTDESCHHATLGTLLLERAPREDPAGVLGNSTATRARPGSGATVFGGVGVFGVFGDTFPALAAALTDRGLSWRRRPVRQDDSWRQAREIMAGGERLVVALDPFYLSYHRQDYGLAHGLHAVLMSRPAGSDGPLLLADPMTATRYEGVVDPAELHRALYEYDAGQSWTRLLPGRPAPLPRGAALAAELRGHASALAVSAEGGDLSAADLARWLSERLPDALAITARLGRPDARAGQDPERRRATNLMRGLWNQAQTLRWFERYLRLALDQGTVALPDSALTAARDLPGQWLVVRTLLLRAGLSPGRRAGALAHRVGLHLERTVGLTEMLAGSLAEVLAAPT